VHALGDAATPEVVDALTVGWSGAMLQAGMGHTDYREMGQRLASFTRLIMGAAE
jgi:hypothetical protein